MRGKSIDKYCFRDCTSLVSVSMTGVTVIPAYAFYLCTSLESIEAGAVTEIGDFAFYGCAVLKAVPSQSTLVSIGQDAFRGCAALETLELTDKVEVIGAHAFAETGLKSVKVPSTKFVMTGSAGNGIGEVVGIFGSCTSLVSAEIGFLPQGCFSRCTSLTDVTLVDGMTRLYWGAFAYCTALGVVDIPATVESTGNQLFAGCLALRQVTMPSNVKYNNDVFHQINAGSETEHCPIKVITDDPSALRNLYGSGLFVFAHFVEFQLENAPAGKVAPGKLLCDEGDVISLETLEAEGYDVLYTVNGQKHIGSSFVMSNQDTVVKATYVDNSAAEQSTEPVPDSDKSGEKKDDGPVIIGAVIATVVIALVMIVAALKVPRKGGA